MAVRASVANLRREPAHAAELVSQRVLGESLRVLEEAGEWTRVAGLDGYEGWVDAGALAPFPDLDGRPVLVWTRRGGLLYEGPGAGAAPCLDLVLGARAVASRRPPEEGLREVVLPGGGGGWAEADAWIEEDALARRFPRRRDAVLQTALGLRGAPYLWGGTSSKAFDCSGFVQRVFGLHGVLLPRDAWQQAEAGEAVDPGAEGAGLEAGDLIFFSEGGRRVTHVAIALGERARLVHCSTGRSGVAVDGLRAGDPLHAPLLARTLVSARRVL